MAEKDTVLNLVYIATNLVNGKRYVGATGKGLAQRRAVHISKAMNGHRTCPRFYDAIRKYGIEVFEWDVLTYCSSFDEALAKEIELIAALSPEYNVAKGGRSGPRVACNRRPVMCLETGILYESGMAAAKANGVGGAEISECCSLKQRAAKGLHFIYAPRKSMRRATRQQLIRKIEGFFAIGRRRRGAVLVTPNRIVSGGRDRIGRSAAGPMANARSVICLDDGKVFPSASAAAESYSVAKSAVIELCLGKNGRRTVGGFRFSYLDHPS